MRFINSGFLLGICFVTLSAGNAWPRESAVMPVSLRAAPHAAGPVANFSCDGPVHAEVLATWQHVVRPYFTQQIDVGLNKIGDVYVLYNIQEEAQDFVEMTRRCKDAQAIDQLASTLEPAFSSLRPLPGSPDVQGWVCSGGHTCTSSNHLLGTEVQLVSTQFLGLIGAVATDIVEDIPAGRRTPAETTFLTSAASAVATQVNHWLSPDYFHHVSDRLRMRPGEDRGGSSSYFFEDRDLWLMTALSDLSELYQAHVEFTAAGAQAMTDLRTKNRQIAGLFNLFLQRVTLSDTPNGPRAEIERGYESNVAENRYARYSGARSPVLCSKQPSGTMQSSLQVAPQPSYVDPRMGWDISHARRLVPALATFARNRSNIQSTFGYSNPDFDPIELQHAFANQIVDEIWSRSSQFPRFSNFWDGNDGWYRAGYENGTGSCAAGTPPYGLSWSIPTGGYLAWGTFNGTMAAIGRSLYHLLYAGDPESRAFVDRFYPQIATQGPAGNSMSNRLWRFTMLSSLVQ